MYVCVCVQLAWSVNDDGKEFAHFIQTYTHDMVALFSILCVCVCSWLGAKTMTASFRSFCRATITAAVPPCL